MQGRRLVMQGHYPRSSAAFLHGQAWPCFSIGECIEYHLDHLSTVSFRTLQWMLRRFFEKGSCVYRHDILQTFFFLLGVHRCGSMERQRQPRKIEVTVFCTFARWRSCDLLALSEDQ